MSCMLPTVPKKDAIIEGTMIILQIKANVACAEHVTIVCSSRLAGDNIGKHTFKLNRNYDRSHVFVHVRIFS